MCYTAQAQAVMNLVLMGQNEKNSGFAQSDSDAQWYNGQLEDLLNLSLRPKMTNNT